MATWRCISKARPTVRPYTAVPRTRPYRAVWGTSTAVLDVPYPVRPYFKVPELLQSRGLPGVLQYGCVTAVLQFTGWQFVHLNFRDILRLHAAKIERLAAADLRSEKSRCGKLVWLIGESADAPIEMRAS